MLRRVLLIALLCATSLGAPAQEISHSIIGGDTLTYSYTPIDQVLSESKARRGLGRYLSSLTEPIPNGALRAPRLLFIAGPGYSTTTNLRLTALGRLYYPIRRCGELAPPSVLTLWASASINGYYNITLDGTNTFAHSRHKLSYAAHIGSMPTYIWGLDYEASLHNPRGKYRNRSLGIEGSYRYMVAKGLMVGGDVSFTMYNATKLDANASALLRNEPQRLRTVGIGIAAEYDSRNDITSPTRGLRATASFMYHPRLFNNLNRELWSLVATLSLYGELWRGGVVGLNIAGEIHPSSTPWMMRSKIGDDNRMRGYYPGRFNGESMATAQVELRQHLWEGLGVAVWGGAGTLFTRNEPWAWHQVLPNYGLGVRWAIGGGTTLRLDAGFGRESFGIIMALSESF